MTKEDIKLVLAAFYSINAVVRASYDAHSAFKYAQTEEYLDRILERYNEMKKRKELKKKHLYEIQNVPVDEDRLREDRRNAV